VRKASKQAVAQIRSRLQKSSSQVDDSMRLINRLVSALSQLHHCRSIHSIRQTCATLSKYSPVLPFLFFSSNLDYSWGIRLRYHTPSCLSLAINLPVICSRAKRLYVLSPTGSATEYSKKCCETLVTAGAVDILLKQIHLLNRGIADQEVLKQVFLTLRNIARCANLRQVLSSTPEFTKIIFQELLRYVYVVCIMQCSSSHAVFTLPG
jgi:abnormal spindle-like microcephaly-associated protein